MVDNMSCITVNGLLDGNMITTRVVMENLTFDKLKLCHKTYMKHNEVSFCFVATVVIMINARKFGKTT